MKRSSLLAAAMAVAGLGFVGCDDKDKTAPPAPPPGKMSEMMTKGTPAATNPSSRPAGETEDDTTGDATDTGKGGADDADTSDGDAGAKDDTAGKDDASK